MKYLGSLSKLEKIFRSRKSFSSDDYCEYLGKRTNLDFETVIVVPERDSDLKIEIILNNFCALLQKLFKMITISIYFNY